MVVDKVLYSFKKKWNVGGGINSQVLCEKFETVWRLEVMQGTTEGCWALVEWRKAMKVGT